MICKFAVALPAIAIIALLSQSPASSQPQRDPETYVTINKDFRDPAQVLDDFHDAAAKADFNRYFSHWTDQSVFLGTDATERWTGTEFRDFARPHFESGRGWTYHPKDRTITTITDDTAFFDELLTHAHYGTCRGSGILHKQNAQWRILQYNLSIPIPTDKAKEVVRLIQSK
jgi:hypothetical protein